MIAKINQLLEQIDALKATNAEELEALRRKKLSKKGGINDIMADVRNVAADQKKEEGKGGKERKKKGKGKKKGKKEKGERKEGKEAKGEE